MKRLILVSVCCWLSLSSISWGQKSASNPLWPFGRSTKASPAESNKLPALNASFEPPATAAAPKSMFGLPSPGKMLNGVEKQTGVMFEKTRSAFKGVQDFGRSLIPFSPKPEKKKQKKSPSLFSSLFSKKQPKSTAPATMGEFLSLPRPEF